MIRPIVIKQMAQRRQVPEKTVEQDYCLGWVLVALNETTSLGETLVLKGGTCLRKLYFPEWRFSEDLDFTAQRQITPGHLIDEFADICRYVEARTGVQVGVAEERTETNPTCITLYLEYVGPLHRVANKGQVKVDVSFDERLVTPITWRSVIMEYEDAPDYDVYVAAYSLEEIAAEKVRSILQRTEPRDLYDLWRVFSDPPGDFDGGNLLDYVVEKCAHKGVRFEGLDQVFSAEREARFRASWKTRLGEQVPYLPDFDEVTRSVRRSIRTWNHD